MIQAIKAALKHLEKARLTNDPRARMLSLLRAEDQLLKEEEFQEQPVETLECSNCAYEGPAANHVQTEITSFHERVDAGEPVPYGQCPECGSLLHPKRPA